MPIAGERQLNVVVAVHGRETKTALFHALNAIPAITIVATATSTAELTSYCLAFRPDVAIVETGLPGRPLGEALLECSAMEPPIRTLVIGDDSASHLTEDIPTAELLRDVDHLLEMLPNSESSR